MVLTPFGGRMFEPEFPARSQEKRDESALGEEFDPLTGLVHGFARSQLTELPSQYNQG
jgi:hypothetical protein